MPYKRNRDLPASVRKALTDAQQTVYRKTFNNVFDQCAAKGESDEIRGDCETKAARVAMNQAKGVEESMLTKDEQIQEAGGSLDDRISQVRDAWYRQRGDNAPVYSYIVDVFEDHVVVCYGNMGQVRRYYEATYTIGEQDITFAAEAEWVEVALTYAPVAATEEADTPVLESLRAVIETAKGRQPEAVIIVEGRSSNGHVFPLPALKTGLPVFTGAKVFADHPTQTEERERPERSVRDVVGKLGEVYLGKDRNGTNALRAPLIISEAEGVLRTKIAEGIIGDLSIRAYAKGATNDEGDFIAESFVASPHTSVDFVTVGAAGGYAVISESAQPPAPADEPAADAVAESDGAEVRLLREANEKLRTENARLVAETRRQMALKLLDGLIPSALATAVQERAREAATPAVESYADSEQSADELRAALAGIIEKERSYLAKILPGGVVTGLSEAEQSGAAQAEVDLEESFRGLVPPGAEKIAARGRG